jgi:hypothetical protein
MGPGSPDPHSSLHNLRHDAGTRKSILRRPHGISVPGQFASGPDGPPQPPRRTTSRTYRLARIVRHGIMAPTAKHISHLRRSWRARPRGRLGRQQVRVSAKLIDRLKVGRSLRDYPIYAPPFARSKSALSHMEMDANYQFFLEQKAARLESLARYLGEFSVQLSFEPETLPTLERWLYRYGGHLVPARGSHVTLGGDPRVASALFNFQPAWVGPYHGLNVVNDIAIFAGEYIISKTSDARWGMWYGDGEKRDRQTGVFGHPCIFGLRHFNPDHRYSMLIEMFECCCSVQCWNDGWILVWERQRQRNLARRLRYLAAPPQEPAAPVSLGKGQKRRKRRGPLVQHKGVKIYEAFKGERSLDWCYALAPNCQAEGSDKVFDIRCLPRKYRSGLLISHSGTYDITLGFSEQQRLFDALDAQRQAHTIAIKRAIDDDYDFNSATRGNYGQFGRRLVRSMRSSRDGNRRGDEASSSVGPDEA